MSKKENSEVNVDYSGIVWMVLIAILFLGVFYMITVPVETFASFECSADYIGLDLETKTIVQNYTSEYSNHNLTNFVENTLKEKLNIKDLKGLNCKGSISLKAPYLLIQNNLFD